jgi:hypothetical protein
MKFFTPELIAMGRSKDHAVLNKQEELWDEACARYFARLDVLKPDLPAGLRKLVDSYYLHDAIVRGMGQSGNTFIVLLQLDTPPQSLLTLTYDLIAEPTINQDALPLPYRARGSQVDWQHDEIEREECEIATWSQSILLSNGWEVLLRFRDVAVQEAAALIPAPRNGEVSLPMASMPQGV